MSSTQLNEWLTGAVSAVDLSWRQQVVTFCSNEVILADWRLCECFKTVGVHQRAAGLSDVPPDHYCCSASAALHFLLPLPRRVSGLCLSGNSGLAFPRDPAHAMMFPLAASVPRKKKKNSLLMILQTRKGLWRINPLQFISQTHCLLIHVFIVQQNTVY